MTEVIDRARKLLEARLREIEAEAESLGGALRGLGQPAPAPSKPRAKRRRRSARKAAPPPAAKSASSPTRKSATRKGRRKSTPKRGTQRAPRGARGDQFLAVVKSKPGARVAEIAKELGISTNQTYALARRLQKQGAVTKRANGYHLPSAKSK